MAGNESIWQKEALLVFEKTDLLYQSQRRGVFLSRENIHHLRQVRRLKGSLALFVSDGKQYYIRGLLHEDNTFFGEAIQPIPNVVPTITAYLPYLRKKQLKWAVEKLTELGVHAVGIFRTEWTAQPSYAMSFLEERAKSACEQTMRLKIPSVFQASFPPPLLKHELGFVALIEASNAVSAYQSLIQEAKALSFVVGPEADFTQQEATVLKKDFRPIRLSKNVLRAETAAVALMAQISGCLLQ